METLEALNGVYEIAFHKGELIGAAAAFAFCAFIMVTVLVLGRLFKRQ